MAPSALVAFSPLPPSIPALLLWTHVAALSSRSTRVPLGYITCIVWPDAAPAAAQRYICPDRESGILPYTMQRWRRNVYQATPEKYSSGGLDSHRATSVLSTSIPPSAGSDNPSSKSRAPLSRVSRAQRTCRTPPYPSLGLRRPLYRPAPRSKCPLPPVRNHSRLYNLAQSPTRRPLARTDRSFTIPSSELPPRDRPSRSLIEISFTSPARAVAARYVPVAFPQPNVP